MPGVTGRMGKVGWWDTQLFVGVFSAGAWTKWPFQGDFGVFCIHKRCLYSIPDPTSFANHRSWAKSQMHPTHPCGPPAFWQTPGPDWKICAQFRGQVRCDPGMIYTALFGAHTICAALARFSFGVSDSLEAKRIRLGQMGAPSGIRRVSSESCGTLRQLNFPPLSSKVQKTRHTGGVRAKELNVQVLSRICQK